VKGRLIWSKKNLIIKDKPYIFLMEEAPCHYFMNLPMIKWWSL
jgi:hypothetical protein